MTLNTVIKATAHQSIETILDTKGTFCKPDATRSDTIKTIKMIIGTKFGSKFGSTRNTILRTTT
ncbi:hypothetical protein LCA02_17530 [Lacticaseibacillus casei]|nr:hypothetical protein LCA02_17530 [Lacticaseibacillus casei]